MSKVRATLEEIQSQIQAVQSELDQLQAKADSTGLTADEQARFEELVTQLEDLKNQEAQASAQQRYAAIKLRDAEPVRPAPKVAASYRKQEPTHAEAFAAYLRGFSMGGADALDHEKARAHGFIPGNPHARLNVTYDKLNFKNRTVMSKGGVGSGKEFIPQTYSDLVTEYLTYFSPILGVLGSETTSDGNSRTYFKVDDTAMESSYITASGGSEVNPTIPETNIVSASVDINTFSITSGFQKVSYQALRDSAVNLENQIAKANANSHARRLEDDVINAAGNGTTGVQGLLAVDNSIGSVSSANYGIDDLESLYYSVPQQYRQNAVWLVNESTAALTRAKLKDDVGRSLFDRNVIDNVEWDTMLGKRFYTSQYMPDDLILFFAPEFYMLRLVSGQIFQVLRERFAPHVAWMGLMDFGGAWLGPTGSGGAIHSLSITS